MLQSNHQGHMMSCAKLSGLRNIKFKIAIQVLKTYTYPFFRILSTTTTASENQPLTTKRKSRIKLEKVFIILNCISNSFLLVQREPPHL